MIDSANVAKKKQNNAVRDMDIGLREDFGLFAFGVLKFEELFNSRIDYAFELSCAGVTHSYANAA